MKTLNCSPPYITNDKQLWCKEKLQFSVEAKSLIWDINNARLDDGQCHPPCEFTKYEFVHNVMINFILSLLAIS